jgi:hypothetical protein
VSDAEYGWSFEHMFKKHDPRRVARELERIRKANDGVITPALVVERARDRSSYLHGMFEWDDTKAAYKYRLHVAGHIVRHVIVLRGDSEVPTRAYHVVTTKGGRTYRSTDDIMSDAELRGQLVERALADFRSWEARYRHLKELSEIFKAAAVVQRKQEREQARASA